MNIFKNSKKFFSKLNLATHAKDSIMRKWGEGQEGRLLQHSKINVDYINKKTEKGKLHNFFQFI